MLYAPGWHFGFNIPAFLIVMLLTVVLVRGIRESAETNNVMVILKIAAILAFIFAGMHYIHPANWHPFAPQGGRAFSLAARSSSSPILASTRFRRPRKRRKTRNAICRSASSLR